MESRSTIGARLADRDGAALEDAYAAEVRAALQDVPDHERVVLELAYYGELTQPEIAARLDLPLGTVKARAARGTRRLAAVLRAQRDLSALDGAAGAEGRTL